MTHPNITRTVKDEEVEQFPKEVLDKLNSIRVDAERIIKEENEKPSVIYLSALICAFRHGYAYSHPDTAQLVAFGEYVLEMAAKKAKSYCSDLAEVNKDSILSLKSRLQQMAEEFKGGEG